MKISFAYLGILFTLFMISACSNNLELVEFSYQIGEWVPLNHTNEYEEFIVNNNKITIHRVFLMPTSCSSQNYSIIKENSTIFVTPQIIPEKPLIDPRTGKEILHVCAAVLGRDPVEINLTLPKGNYNIIFNRCDNYIDRHLPDIKMEICNSINNSNIIECNYCNRTIWI